MENTTQKTVRVFLYTPDGQELEFANIEAESVTTNSPVVLIFKLQSGKHIQTSLPYLIKEE